MSAKRVAVVGGGISGLVSIKTCLEEGFEPVCFEQTDQYGGIWVIRDEKPSGPCPGARMYDCLITNSSKEMMCFSDFPFDADAPPYLRGDQLLSYYQAYAKRFGLERFIRLNTTVKTVEQSHDFEQSGRWRVRSQMVGREEQEETFDAVFICTGRYSSQHIPNVSGMADFSGKIMHSGGFKNGREFANKTVVVVGGSHSAGDVAVDVSRYAKQTYLSMRSGTWVLPRQGPASTPLDAFMNRRVFGYLPVNLTRNLFKAHVSQRMNLDALGLQSSRPLLRTTSVMVNDEIGIRIWCGALKAKPNIAKFTVDGVLFDDGSSIDHVDAVVFATGFQHKFPFLDESILKHDQPDPELYWHVFPPRLARHTMAIIGIVGTIGAQGPVFELQARLAARVFKGKVTLPSEKAMLMDVQKRKARYHHVYGNQKVFFPPTSYMDMLASKMGCRPAFLDLLKTDLSLAFKFIFGSNHPMFYRLVGPHAWAGARDAIMRAPGNTTNPTKTRTCVAQRVEKESFFHIFHKLMAFVAMIAFVLVAML
ncbi:flavin-containing monooxygenase 5-like [Diadema antillarum]|uniref:flavin-containing monooxygenase 5-like n=1 Tax=Diadema antillarum TaxID=105358 RepID=UPI003A87B74B